MARLAWYMLAYDVREPKRLHKVHHYLCKRGVPMQESVFFIHASSHEVNCILGDLEKLINQREDDLRAYPIGNPSNVWIHGYNAFAAKPDNNVVPKVGFLGKLKNLLGIFHV